MVITKDSKYIVSGSLDRSLKIFDLQTQKEVYNFKGVHRGRTNLYTLFTGIQVAYFQ